MSNRLESIETKTALNLEFKGEVLAIEERCMAIDKMDTGVSYKVDATEGPKKYEITSTLDSDDVEKNNNSASKI